MTSSISAEEPEYEKVSLEHVILIMTSFMTSSTSSLFPVGLLLLGHLYRQYGVSAVMVLHTWKNILHVYTWKAFACWYGHLWLSSYREVDMEKS